jgi:hypothetical protein
MDRFVIKNFFDKLRELEINEALLEKFDSGISFPDDKILLLTDNLPELDLQEWLKWERALKVATYFNQKEICASCHQLLGTAIEQHHALISRKDVQGMPKTKGLKLLHNSFNVVVVHSGNCHSQFSRNEAFSYLSSIWGEDVVREWHNNLPFNSTMRKF